MAATTKKALAEMIKAVRDNNDPDNVDALELLMEDMAHVEWLCKELPEEKLKALEAAGKEPLW